MANSLSKVEQIAWEEACEAFEASNVFANNADVYKPDAGFAESAGQTIRIPYAYQIQSSTGLDVSSDYKDITDITVPISLSASDIKNASFTLSAIEGNVSHRVSGNMLAAVRKISSDVSTDVANTIIDKGALVGAETTALTTYAHFAKADAMLDEIEAGSDERFLYLNPRMGMGLANELGMRATDNSRDHAAYGNAQLPQVASFQTYKTNALKEIAADSVTTVTVNGADQDSDPVAYKSDVTPSAPSNNDIRTQVLTVTNTSGSLTNGDVFTIAGVNRVGIDTKTDTGQLMTFRVISGGGTTSVTISPAIVAAGAYQNVSAAPGNGAVITAINTAASSPAVFTTKNAVRLFASDLNVEALAGSAATVLGTYTTSSGLSVAFIRQGTIDTLATKYRFTTWSKANVVDPLKCGLLLPSQGAAI